ncbi:hypothetical protein CEE34_01580 [Candidatus Aerophobetes bacterium Ae_b3a]|nr:MAG: hypothetical protein CEE34_01580 [Candidatus Aerophobetes bacterium Ae_b3a]
MNRKKEAGFTLVEVMVAIAILSFAIFATLRVITASLNSINRQGQRAKALHLAQAHLVELETNSFSLIVPESWVINSSPPTYQLNIYDSNVSANEILVSSDDDYWYDDDDSDTEDLGFDDTGQTKTDGILVVAEDGTPYTATLIFPPPPGYYNWDSSTLTLTFSSSDKDNEVQIYYRYYHLIEEGGTIPMFDGEGLKKSTIKLITSVGDTDGSGTPGEKSDIMGDDLTDDAPLSSSDYESFNSQTRELTFAEDKGGSSVYIYYLSKKGTDIDSDGCKDPLDDAILGVVEGSFYNPDGSIANQITDAKKVSVTEYWRQGENIQSTRQEAYINK